MPRYLGVHFLDARFDDVDTRHPEVAAIVSEGNMFSSDGEGRAVIVQRNSDGVVRGYVAFRAELDWHARAGVDVTDRDALRSYLVREFSGWSPVTRPLITDNDGDYVQRGFWALPAPLTWGRVPSVTLIGDAAYLMAPFGGHGTNLALLDDAELAHAVAKESSLDDAVARYETGMFPRSGELAVSSNTALTQFFATTSPDAPHLPPDHAREHENYAARAAEYRTIASASREMTPRNRDTATAAVLSPTTPQVTPAAATPTRTAAHTRSACIPSRRCAAVWLVSSPPPSTCTYNW